MTDTPPEVPGVEHRYVDAAGLRTHVALAGPEDSPDPPVVLLHGWPQHWWLWRHVMTSLAAAGRRSIAIDLRGHGWTDVPERGYEKEQFATDVLAALDALGVDRFSLAGHDWGGWTAQLIALRVPDRVERMTLLNIPPIWGDPKSALPNFWRLAYQVPLVTPVIGRLVQQNWLFSRRLFLGVDEADARVYAERWSHPERAAAGQQVYRDVWRKDLPTLVRGDYDGRRLTMPLLVVHGTKDFVVHTSMVERFREHADDVTFDWVRGAGHFVIDQEPDRVADAITAWTAGTVAAT